MPISSFYGLQTSLRGLLAQQRSIDITGHNIANAATVGYSRQEAVLAPARGNLVEAGAKADGSGALLGAGVDVADYRRVRDQFLDVQYRAQATRLGGDTARAEHLGRAELALAEPSDDGVSSQLEKFWSAWADFANAPEEPATRRALVEQATTLADALATVDRQLATTQSQAAQEYANLTAADGEIDLLAAELAELNGTIRQYSTAGVAPNDMLDRRDVVIDKLAQYAQVSVENLGEGMVKVSFGDAANPLVDGMTSDWPQTLSSPGGRLGALKQLSATPGGTLDSWRADLNTVAKGIADAVNGLHTTPPFFGYTAGSEAASLTVNATTATLKSSNTSTAAGANDLALQIAALRDGGPDQAYAAFVARVGTEVREAERQQGNAKALSSAVEDRRDSVSGVALDEEMTNLVRFQRAYQASARAMSTMDEMLDVLINRTGRVGL